MSLTMRSLQSRSCLRWFMTFMPPVQRTSGRSGRIGRHSPEFLPRTWCLAFARYLVRPVRRAATWCCSPADARRGAPPAPPAKPFPLPVRGAQPPAGPNAANPRRLPPPGTVQLLRPPAAFCVHGSALGPQQAERRRQAAPCVLNPNLGDLGWRVFLVIQLEMSEALEKDKKICEQEEEVEEYVLLELDDCLYSDLPPGAPFVLSGLDTLTPTLIVGNNLKMIGEYEETVGTCYLFSDSEAQPKPSDATKSSEVNTDKPASSSKEAPSKEVNHLASVQKVLKFRPVNAEHLQHRAYEHRDKEI